VGRWDQQEGSDDVVSTSAWTEQFRSFQKYNENSRVLVSSMIGLVCSSKIIFKLDGKGLSFCVG